ANLLLPFILSNNNKIFYNLKYLLLDSIVKNDIERIITQGIILNDKEFMVIVKLLLDNGVDRNMSNSFGFTILMRILDISSEILDLFLEHCVNPNAINHNNG